METFAQLIARLMANPTTVRQALNRRDAERTNPVDSPLNAALPVKLVNSHVAEGISEGYADVVMVPTAVDGDWAPVNALPERTVWRGETQRFTLKQTLTARDRRVLQADLDAAQLGRNTQTPMEVAQNYFNANFLVKVRRAAEYAEALAVARATTSGRIAMNYGTGWTLDYKLPGKSRTGAQNYVQAPANFWADMLEAKNAVNGIARVVMNDTTFNAVLGASPATSGIVATGLPVDLGNGNYQYVIRRLSQLKDGTYDLNSNYPDGRFAPITVTVMGQKAKRYAVTGEGDAAVVTVVEEKLVEDGVIAVHGLDVLGYLHVGPNDIDSNLGRGALLWKPSPQLVEMIAEENLVPVINERNRIYVLRTTLTGA